jgi:hypothetical protein
MNPPHPRGVPARRTRRCGRDRPAALALGGALAQGRRRGAPGAKPGPGRPHRLRRGRRRLAVVDPRRGADDAVRASAAASSGPSSRPGRATATASRSSSPTSAGGRVDVIDVAARRRAGDGLPGGGPGADLPGLGTGRPHPGGARQRRGWRAGARPGRRRGGAGGRRATAAIRPFARGAPFYWTWSRSGRSLLVHQNVLGPTALVGSTGIDAFDVRAPLPEPGAFQSPALSSSERYVAYATIGADGRGSVVASRTRSGRTRACQSPRCPTVAWRRSPGAPARATRRPARGRWEPARLRAGRPARRRQRRGDAAVGRHGGGVVVVARRPLAGHPVAGSVAAAIAP